MVVHLDLTTGVEAGVEEGEVSWTAFCSRKRGLIPKMIEVEVEVVMEVAEEIDNPKVLVFDLGRW